MFKFMIQTPFISFTLAYLFMLYMALNNNCKAYNKYTGWVRLQVIALLPYLFIESTSINAQLATTLIWNNTVGCFIAVHLVYALTNYELLFILAGRSLKRIGMPSSWIYCFLADGVIHGLPALLALYITCRLKPCHSFSHVWLVTGIPNTTFCFVLTGQWDPCTLYEVPPYPKWKTRIMWPIVLFGHFIASYLQPYRLTLV